MALCVGRADAMDDAARKAEGGTGAQSPYSRLRDSTLHYHGPSEDESGLSEYRIGWFGPNDTEDPLTGDLWFAANLALADANNATAAGTGTTSALPFRFVPCWSTDVWGSGASQLARMVYDEKPLALIGSVDSAATHLAEQIVAKAQLPLVSPVATDPSLTLAGVSWMFSCAPSDDALARALVDAVFGPSAAGPTEPASVAVRHTSLILLSTTDHESRMTQRSVVRECSRRGLLPAMHLEIEPGTADLAAQMRAAAAAKPSAVLVVAGVEDAARITHAVRAALGPVEIFGGPSFARHRFRFEAGAAAEGVVFPLLYPVDRSDPVATDFADRFTAARGYPPDYAAAQAFDATRMLTAALRRAGPNRARVREALIALSPWAGIAGPIDFDGTGQNRHAALTLGTIRAGKVVAFESTDTPASPVCTAADSVSVAGSSGPRHELP